MIEKIPGTENGYYVDAETTKEEWRQLWDERKRMGKIKCIICNYGLADHFTRGIFCRSKIIINDKAGACAVYFNEIK